MTVRTHSWLRCRGGAASVARALHAALAAAGRAAGFGFELDDGPCDPLTGEGLCPPAVAGRLAAGQPVHAHGSGHWPALLSGLAEAGTRTVATLHDCRLLTGGCPYPLDCEAWRQGCPEPCPRAFAHARDIWAAQREALARCRPVLVAPSSWMADLARATLPDLDVRVIPNGVTWPASLPGRAEAKARCGLSPDTPLALFAAHGGEEAGYKAGERWQGLWRAIRAEVPGAACYMAGGREASRDRDAGLFRWPWLEPDMLRLFMRAADVFVYPTHADNHPLLILEAMSMGCAVAAFAVGGVPEQIVAGRTGVLVRPGDWDGLAREAAALLRNRAGAHALGRAARAEGAERFGLERMVAEHLKLYDELESPAV